MQNAGTSVVLQPVSKTTEFRNRKFVILTLAAARISILREENKMAGAESLRIILDAGREQFSGLFCHI